MAVKKPCPMTFNTRATPAYIAFLLLIVIIIPND